MMQVPIGTEPSRGPSQGTDWKPDHPDERDFVFARLLSTGGVSPPIAETPFDTVLWKPEILSQPTLDLKDLSTNSLVFMTKGSPFNAV